MTKVIINAKVDPKLKRALAVAAANAGTNSSAFVVSLLENDKRILGELARLEFVDVKIPTYTFASNTDKDFKKFMQKTEK